MDDLLKEKVRDLLLLLLEAREMEGVKAWAIGIAFIYAAARDPNANKKEVWDFLKGIYTKKLHEVYPEQEDPAQSYRRASGDAFEYFVLQYINSNPSLAKHGIRAIRLAGEDFDKFIKRLDLHGMVRQKDVDIFLQGIGEDGYPQIFGAVFPKVSYAERIRADVVPSQVLMRKGLWSITVTLDARDELGTEEHPSVKRQTINNGGFHACYSLNNDTVPGRRIRVVDVREKGMSNSLVRDVVRAWHTFSSGKADFI